MCTAVDLYDDAIWGSTTGLKVPATTVKTPKMTFILSAFQILPIRMQPHRRPTTDNVGLELAKRKNKGDLDVYPVRILLQTLQDSDKA